MTETDKKYYKEMELVTKKYAKEIAEEIEEEINSGGEISEYSIESTLDKMYKEIKPNE
ncbi:MAG: hypothetical protein H8E55_49230 [Pelagibacterales bacterium]|nr:hypothetical protein [Pelagibacterales bacterium]